MAVQLVVDPRGAIEGDGEAALRPAGVVRLAGIPVGIQPADGRAGGAAQPERVAVGPPPVPVGRGLVASDPQGVRPRKLMAAEVAVVISQAFSSSSSTRARRRPRPHSWRARSPSPTTASQNDTRVPEGGRDDTRLPDPPPAPPRQPAPVPPAPPAPAPPGRPAAPAAPAPPPAPAPAAPAPACAASLRVPAAPPTPPAAGAAAPVAPPRHRGCPASSGESGS